MAGAPPSEQRSLPLHCNAMVRNNALSEQPPARALAATEWQEKRHAAHESAFAGFRDASKQATTPARLCPRILI